jgi:glycosyltransferase involved in cell wall biosynthesis
MSRDLPPLYFFNWPSKVGGADTKFAHLLRLLCREAEITVVPNSADRLAEDEWRQRIESLGAKAALREELPLEMHGWAVSLCNEAFFSKGILFDMRQRGLNVAWSSEMMWHFREELGAVLFGWIDVVLYVSAVQRKALEPGYRHALSAGEEPPDAAPLADPDANWGVMRSAHTGKELRWVTTGNYIDPADFPFRRRGGGERPFTIGRLSRPDPDKFPDNFPESYESLGLREPCRFRVMAWSEQLRERWREHVFDARWELLGAASEPTVDFLHSLDVLVYDVGPRFKESWGRAVVEAMLTGAVPLVPRGGGHHLENVVPHGIGGFHCDGAADFAKCAAALQNDPALLARMSRAAREWAETKLCHADDHLALWRRVFCGE